MPPPPPSPHALLHALAFATVSARPLSRTCFPAPRALCQVKTTQIVTQPNRRLAQPSFGVPAWKATMGTPSAVVEELQLHASDGATVAAFLVRSQPHRPSRTAVVLMTDILGYENHETRAVAMLLAAHGFTTSKSVAFRSPYVRTVFCLPHLNYLIVYTCVSLFFAPLCIAPSRPRPVPREPLGTGP